MALHSRVQSEARDNNGLSSLMLVNMLNNSPWGPFTPVEALRLKKMLFLVVDAGRPVGGDWAKVVRADRTLTTGWSIFGRRQHKWILSEKPKIDPNSGKEVGKWPVMLPMRNFTCPAPKRG